MRIIDGGYIITMIELESIYETIHNGEKVLLIPMLRTRNGTKSAMPELNKERIDELIQLGASKTAICKEFDISRYQLNKWLIANYGKAAI